MPLNPGILLGPYEILAPIGSGGMGEVWTARDTRLDRIVAIKQLKGAHGTRFAQEARAIAALNHPHICQIYDVGDDYLVLEYVDGKPLSGPLPLDESLKLALQMAGALEEAHIRGILHRDLKPGNIMVTARGGIKLLDFGLAKLLEPGDSDATQTVEGTVLGTAAYMAPEQAQGKPLDERSDIFSFGSVLYEMLSGKRAFNGSSMVDVLSAVIRDEPATLDSPAWGIIARCLAKNPTERYRSMAELKGALETKVGGSTTSSVTAQVSVTPQQPSIAVLPFANMSADGDQEYFSDGLAEEIINLLAQIPGLKVIARTSSFAFRGREHDIAAIAKALRVTTILEGSVRRAGNRVRVTVQLISPEDGSHLFSQRYDKEMADIFAVQDEIASAIAAALRVRLSIEPAERRNYTPNLLSYEALLKARHCLYKLTPDSVARGRGYLEQAISLDSGFSLPHSELGFQFVVSPILGVMPAHEATPLARTEVRKALDIDPAQPEALSVLGYIAAFYDYDWAEAGRLFSLAAAYGPISPMARSCYARYLGALGRPAESIVEYEATLSDDPLNLFFRANLASGLLAAGRPADAADECRRILELAENYHSAWLLLSIASFQQGDSEEALPAARKAVALAPWNLEGKGILAGLLALAGDKNEAEQVLQRLGDGGAYGAPVGLVHYSLIIREIDQAADWAARAIGQRAPVIANILRAPFAADLRRSPRWPELTKLMNLPESGYRFDG
jgi:eukaryotic-like serine/threonine-protein kinase